MNDKINPPKAHKIVKELVCHDHVRIDHYYWLNERESADVREYLHQENDYTSQVMKDTESLQQSLYEEIVGRIKQDDTSVPYYSNGYYYYVKFLTGKEYPLHCRKKTKDSKEEEIMLDINEMAKDHNYYKVRGLSISDDNKLLAFGVDTFGRREYKIYIKDLCTGEIFDYNLGNTLGNVAWANDNETFFFTGQNSKTLRSEKVYRFSLKEKKAQQVFHETQEEFISFAYKTKSKKYIIIGSYNVSSTEYRFLDADNPMGEFQLIQKREKNLEYSVDHYQDKFYIITNYNAVNFKLVSTPVTHTTKEHWEDIVPHREDTFIENIEIFKDYLVIEERKLGLQQLRIIKWEDFSEHFISFEEPAYTTYIGTNKEFDTELLRYGYSSLTTPSSVFDYNLNTREKTLLKQQEVLGDFNINNYVSERLYAITTDNVQIPISLVYRKDKKNDAGNSLLLYGYGSYGISSDPIFSSMRLSLLDRGFIFAIAHVRGGQELGRSWYENGKMFHKKNTFYDFLACAEHLIEKKYTTPQKLFAEGRSAGGLLMGAILNMRPDLFHGVIASVPFVDVVTTMLDESIPLTAGEYNEWGNPNQKESYDYMLSYSPYDNIKQQDYPNILITTGFYDSQVQYWEPAKWIAKLREMKTDNNYLLFKIDMDAGHTGVSGRFRQYKMIALEYAFLLSLCENATD